MIGIAFKDMKLDPTLSLFPTVGLRTPGEILEANFGQRAFRFDIRQYILVSLARLVDIKLILLGRKGKNAVLDRKDTT
jgi:hypothetical protein